jgi:hypothetical protein
MPRVSKLIFVLTHGVLTSHLGNKSLWGGEDRAADPHSARRKVASWNAVRRGYSLERFCQAEAHK